MDNKVLDGTDLILSVNGNALGYATDCKISTSVETGERVTKESTSGKWKEKYVKSFSETITASGCVLTNGSATMPTYDQLRKLQIAGSPVECQYSVREDSTREGDDSIGYKGSYIITSLDLEGAAGDDAKYSVTLENSGAVTAVATGGLSKTTV